MSRAEASPHLVQGESADTESGQFDGVQQGHLGHAICFCATAGPVLVTLNLEVKERMDRGHQLLVLQQQRNMQLYTASLYYSSAHALPPVL